MEEPECPYSLGEAGSEWWSWAWKTSQAQKWDGSALYTVARRARLEDEIAALEFDDLLELADLLAGAEEEAIDRVEFAFSTLKRSASGEITLMKEMRELETHLGLGPKAMAGLGWKPEAGKRDGLDDLSSRRARRLAGGAAT